MEHSIVSPMIRHCRGKGQSLKYGTDCPRATTKTSKDRP